jgi:hypothetical protein
LIDLTKLRFRFLRGCEVDLRLFMIALAVRAELGQQPLDVVL